MNARLQERAWMVARVVGTLLFAAYFIKVMSLRMHGAWGPWAADGDQPQAVWHYWRYRIAGALPPGNLVTDYAFVMHAPPAWWAMMAGLSSFMDPLVAAKIADYTERTGRKSLKLQTPSIEGRVCPSKRGTSKAPNA